MLVNVSNMKIRVNLMNVKITFRKFALNLCVGFVRAVKMLRYIPLIR